MVEDVAAEHPRGLSIGELVARTGVADGTLRAWERRYGLLQPRRTAGGHRRYSDADVARILHMVGLQRDGLPAGVAAAQVTRRRSASLPEEAGTDPARVRAHRRQLAMAADALDAAAVLDVLSEAAGRASVTPLLDALVVPELRRLGERWRSDARHIAREHVTSTAMRSWLVSRLRDITNPAGSPTVVACPDGELHDLGAVMAAVTLAEIGWRPVLLGASTPWASAATVIDELRPPLVMIGAMSRPAALRLLDRWRAPNRAAVVFGGPALTARDVAGIPAAEVHRGRYVDLAATVDEALRAGAGSERDGDDRTGGGEQDLLRGAAE